MKLHHFFCIIIIIQTFEDRTNTVLDVHTSYAKIITFIQKEVQELKIIAVVIN